MAAALATWHLAVGFSSLFSLLSCVAVALV